MTTTYFNSGSPIDCSTPVERFQSGEFDAFDEIVSKYRERVYSLAYRFTHNAEDSFDISQEVFIKVFKSLGRLKDTTVFEPWLRKVTMNACVDYFRRRSNESNLEHSTVVLERISGNERTDGPVECDELRSMIARAMNQLPKRQKKVFMLRHYEELTLREIAQALNCSIGTVKAHLFRATRRMRKLLAPYAYHHA